jgi:tetratricopeptide (TPR) repeat protein
MAFDLEMSKEDAAKVFSNPEDLIYQKGTTWLPIETTLRTGHFMDAWAEGIHQWRTGVEQKNAKFYAVREAWQMYNPIVFSGNTAAPSMPNQNQIATAFRGSLEAFVDRQLTDRVTDLQQQIKSSGGNPLFLNRLGLLYAKFGVLDKAEAQFSTILKNQDPCYALTNMGNVCFLRGKYSEALAYFTRAQRKEPTNAKVLLSLAKTNLVLEKYTAANQTYEKLKTIDTDLASHYAFLGASSSGGTRAADVQKVKGEVIWLDE